MTTKKNESTEEAKSNLTEVQQVKLAVAIPGTTSQTLMAKDFELLYDSSKMCLYVQKKKTRLDIKTVKYDKFVIFTPNIAYIKL